MIPFPIGYYQQQGAGFDPSQIPDILYWLDFTDSNVIDLSVDDTITDVYDKANSWDFFQSASGQRPAYLNDGTHNYAKFSEEPFLKSRTAVTMPATNKFSVFVVCKLYDDLDGNGGILLETSTNTNTRNDSLLCSLNSTTTNRILSTYRDSSFSQTGVDYSAEYGNLNFLVFTFDKDEATLTSRTNIFLNDGFPTQINSIVNNTGVSNWGSYQHFIGERSGGVAELFADIYEIGTIGRRIELAEVQQIFNDYVNPKYSIK